MASRCSQTASATSYKNPKLRDIPEVEIDKNGKFKYILIKVHDPDIDREFKHIVRGTSKAAYHDLGDEQTPLWHVRYRKAKCAEVLAGDWEIPCKCPFIPGMLTKLAGEKFKTKAGRPAIRPERFGPRFAPLPMHGPPPATILLTDGMIAPGSGVTSSFA
ncbi:14 kDa phosphohistidine phosphatase-like [Elysia marginata]|uniref:14 kDa phosphohistidine phosphatase-like n=1 Tax=Elysia marginata TaxID=1093978 RepID=A0AAV4EBN4_9GAST|nr:14 kDa phosphohistidine phosphatase-like [Elysia marginata]